MSWRTISVMFSFQMEVSIIIAYLCNWMILIFYCSKASKLKKLHIWLLNKNWATLKLIAVVKMLIYSGLVLWSFGNTAFFIELISISNAGMYSSKTFLVQVNNAIRSLLWLMLLSCHGKCMSWIFHLLCQCIVSVSGRVYACTAK